MSEFVNLSPNPLPLIESLRSLGYSIQTAVADILDNSIYADAVEIHIDFSWNTGNPWLAITDNGYGMSKEELIAAMRFGSLNPLALRSTHDLGRFGLGLKTASLSQCRHLTIMSKRNGEISCCEWDLERISAAGNGAWSLGILDLEDAAQREVLGSIYQRSLESMNSGTIVLWENIDRVCDQGTIAKQDSYFNAQIDDTRKHLELVFHRFLSPEDVGKRRVHIFMNRDELTAVNPFNPRNLATQELEEQKIVLDGTTIVVQPYVLPHHSKVSREEYDKYAGEGGYLHNQGFYVYRNRRLIIKGTWFGLMKKVELNKLLRVRVDIPNTLDHLWRIDVRKAHASPPEAIRTELRQVISRIEISGRRVYRQRGRKLQSGVTSPVWNRIARGGSISYRINRDHPLLKELFEGIPAEKTTFLRDTISMIESSFPTDMFFHDVANDPESVEQPRLEESELSMLLGVFLESWGFAGRLTEQVIEKVLAVDPFASNRDMTLEIVKRRMADE
jgi:hypothetical protein